MTQVTGMSSKQGFETRTQRYGYWRREWLLFRETISWQIANNSPETWSFAVKDVQEALARGNGSISRQTRLGLRSQYDPLRCLLAALKRHRSPRHATPEEESELRALVSAVHDPAAVEYRLAESLEDPGYALLTYRHITARLGIRVPPHTN